MRTAVLSLLAAATLVVAGCGSSNSKSHSSQTKAAGAGGASTGQAVSTKASCPHNPVRFAVEPYDQAPVLQKAYKSVATALQTKLGCKVQLTITNSYVAEIEAMRADQLELGEFGPLGYVFAHKIANAQTVATFGTPQGKPSTYTAGIWVPKSSPIKTVAQLKGKTLALADPSSTSGALYPVYALVQAGFKCHAVASCAGVTLKYAGGHAQSMLALVHGTVDASEVNSQQQLTATQSHTFDPSKYRQIWKSEPIYNDPIAVRGDLPAAFKARVIKAIRGLKPSQVKEAEGALGTGSVGPMVPAPDSLFSGIAKLAQQEGLTTKNLG